MTTMRVMPSLDEPEGCSARLVMVVEVRAVEQLAFEGGEEALGQSECGSSHPGATGPASLRYVSLCAGQITPGNRPSHTHFRSHEPVDLPGPTSRANQAFVGRRVHWTLRWSSSPFASIARSSRRRRFSRRSRRISSRSALLSPSPRRSSSRSACATQLRIAWAVGSNCLPSADNNIAIHELIPPVSVRCAPTRPSGAGRPAEPAPVETGGGLDFGMVDTSSPLPMLSSRRRRRFGGSRRISPATGRTRWPRATR